MFYYEQSIDNGYRIMDDIIKIFIIICIILIFRVPHACDTLYENESKINTQNFSLCIFYIAQLHITVINKIKRKYE